MTDVKVEWSQAGLAPAVAAMPTWSADQRLGGPRHHGSFDMMSERSSMECDDVGSADVQFSRVSPRAFPMLASVDPG